MRDSSVEPYGEQNGVGWSACERCPRVFVRGTHLEAYSAKVEHWFQYH